MKLPLLISILFSSVMVTFSTELCYIHRWNIYCVSDAQEGSNKSSQYMLDSAARRPIGLSYGEHCGSQCSPYLLFTENDLSDGTLFGINVTNWREKRPYFKIDLETLMRSESSTPIPTKLEYDPINNEVYTLSDSVDTVLRSQLPKKLIGPSKLTTELYTEKGAQMVDLSLDHCNRTLHVLQHTGNKSSFLSLSLQSSRTTSINLLVPESDGMYKALHYDPYSASIYLAFTDKDNATTFDNMATNGSNVLRHIKTVNNSLPYDMTSDDQFLYWSDWAREGVMRIRKDGAGEPVLVAKHESQDGYHGAMELTALLNPLDLCPGRTHVVEQDGVQQDHPEKSGVRKSIIEDSKEKTDPIENAFDKSKESSVVQENKKVPPTSKEITKNIGDSQEKVEISQKVNPVQSDIVLHYDESKESSEEKDSSPPTQEENVGEEKERTIVLWSKSWTSSEALVLFSSLVCVIVLLSCLLTASVCIYYTHICRTKSAVVKYTRHAGFEEQGSSDYSLKKDVIVNDEAENSLPSKPTKKKVFRASKDKFSRLKPKPSNCDGVSINIEDCCQMTLCETPCYTSVSKQGRDYLDTCDSSDKSSLLSNCHTSC